MTTGGNIHNNNDDDINCSNCFGDMDDFINVSKPSPCCSKDTSAKYQNTLNSSASSAEPTDDRNDNNEKEFENVNDAGPSQIPSSSIIDDNDNLDWKVDIPIAGPSRQTENLSLIPESALDTSGHPDYEWEWSACSDKSPKQSTPVIGRESVIVYDDRRGTYNYSSKIDDNSRSRTPIPAYDSWNTPNIDWAALPAAGSRGFERNPPLPPRTSTLTSGAYSLASSLPLPTISTDEWIKSYQENPNNTIAAALLRKVGELYYENSSTYQPQTTIQQSINNFSNFENRRNLQKPVKKQVNFDSFVKDYSRYSAPTVKPNASPSTAGFQPITSPAPFTKKQTYYNAHIPNSAYNNWYSGYQNVPSTSRAIPPLIHYEQNRASKHTAYQSPLEINTVIRGNRNRDSENQKKKSEFKRLDKYSPLPQRSQQERKKGRGGGKKFKPIMSPSASVSTTLTLQTQPNPTAPKTHDFPMLESRLKIDEGSNPKKNK